MEDQPDRPIMFSGFSCFRKGETALPPLKPMTLVVGQNNSGKSHYLRMIELSTEKTIGNFLGKAYRSGFKMFVPFDDRHNTKGYFSIFKEEGDHWETKLGNLTFNYLALDDTLTKELDVANRFENKIKEHLAEPTPFSAKRIRFLNAERDLIPEVKGGNKELILRNGQSATALIQTYLQDASNLDRAHIVEHELIGKLNSIIHPAENFTAISVRMHNEASAHHGKYEIYLHQNSKKWVALSDSGSSIKTILLILINTMVVPSEQKCGLSDYVFCFEELENNLHPTTLRRLLSYLDELTKIENPPHFFLTTHSSVALDYFAGHERAQIVHITHDGESSYASIIDQSSDHLNILRDLGTRPSDLLQANGIIWVEGPSDRIYLNRWIELFSDGKLEEGRHYQFAIYGGSLLADLQVTPREGEDTDLINLLTINPNVLLISDSDKTTDDDELKERVLRIKNEFEKLNEEFDQDTTWHWVLEAKEIENYLTADLINEALSERVADLRDPGQYERFFSGKTEGTKGYLESEADRKTFDKVKLAALTTPHMTKENLENRFDLGTSMEKIISMVETWNR